MIAWRSCERASYRVLYQQPTPARLGSTSSGGAICNGCADRIFTGQIEYEVEFANALFFRLHRACYVSWEAERQTVRREIAGGSAASAWTFVFDYGIARRAAEDPVAFQELLVASAETMFMAAATRRSATALRQDSKRLRVTSASLA